MHRRPKWRSYFVALPKGSVHTLKGSSRSIGAMNRGNLCGEIEFRMKLEKPEDSPELVKRLQAPSPDAQAPPPSPPCQGPSVLPLSNCIVFGRPPY